MRLLNNFFLCCFDFGKKSLVWENCVWNALFSTKSTDASHIQLLEGSPKPNMAWGRKKLYQIPHLQQYSIKRRKAQRPILRGLFFQKNYLFFPPFLSFFSKRSRGRLTLFLSLKNHVQQKLEKNFQSFSFWANIKIPKFRPTHILPRFLKGIWYHEWVFSFFDR